MNALWGRFDQTVANINTLYQSLTWKEDQPLNVYLVSEDSIVFCLEPVREILLHNIIITGLETLSWVQYMYTYILVYTTIEACSVLAPPPR